MWVQKKELAKQNELADYSMHKLDSDWKKYRFGGDHINQEVCLKADNRAQIGQIESQSEITNTVERKKSVV